MKPAEFVAASPVALRASMMRWGNAQPFASTKQNEARRLARGAGLLVTVAEEGRFPSADKTGPIQPTAIGELRAAIERGESWSSALARAHTADPGSKNWRLSAFFTAPNEITSSLGNRPDLDALIAWKSYASDHFWNPRTWAPTSGNWWVVFYFPQTPAKIIAAAKASEADARQKLTTSAEPAEVRALRNDAAAGFYNVMPGIDISLADARQAFAKGRGLSDTEATNLRKTPTMTTTITNLVPRSSLLASMEALRRMQPVASVNTARIAAVRRLYQPMATTTQMVTREGTAPAGAMVEAPSTYPTGSVAVGGIAGAILGGIAGRMIFGSWTGAAAGAGMVGIGGALGGYAYGSGAP